jgi:hypothetical protein
MDPILIKLMETLLFKGKTHSKRGAGILRFPEKMLRKPDVNVDIKEEIKKVFLKKFGTHRSEEE